MPKPGRHERRTEPERTFARQVLPLVYSVVLRMPPRALCPFTLSTWQGVDNDAKFCGVKPTRSTDAREQPCYPIAYAAHLTRVPESTLRAWVAGRSYPTKGGSRRAAPVIRPAALGYLSFINLVEAHALAAMRREYQLKLDKIRKAVRYVEKQLRVDHPLARQEFKTDGVELFVEHLGRLLNVSKDGQLGIREALGDRLERVEYEAGFAARLYPWVRPNQRQQPRLVVIDPNRAFGRPVLAESGIPVESVQERFQGGESLDELAKDYGVGVDAIEEALRAA